MRSRFLLLFVVFISAAIFFRVYRTPDFLGFWYDQGRDALVIWDLIYNHKFFLVGPTTGIEGIFRGPWYYWLITPLYYLGQGDPLWPAIFLASTTVIAAILCASLAFKLGGRTNAIVALAICALSYEFITQARWLSNPTPMFLISMVIVWFGLRIIEGQKNYWIPLSFALGMAMQFGSATEVFLYPAFGIMACLKKEIRPSPKILFYSVLAGLVPYLPLTIFDFRHDHILSKNVFKFFIADKSFQLSFFENLAERLPFYLRLLGSKLSPTPTFFTNAFIFLSIFLGIKNFKSLTSPIRFVILLTVAPLVGMLFFQGNHGNVYDYYFTGFHFIFVLAFSLMLSNRLLASLFLCVFIYSNLPWDFNFINASGGTFITYTSEKNAVDWIYQDAKNKEFNVDFYVPPMIPYSYKYLFLWRGTRIHGRLENASRANVLYTIQEPDPDHPTLLAAWRDRQAGLSRVLESHYEGSLLIEKRIRHE